MADKPGMTSEDAMRAAVSALNEIARLMRGMSRGSAEAEGDPWRRGYQGPDYEEIYVREQLERVGELAEWMRDHLENLTDPDFVAQQSERMKERAAEKRRGGD